MSSAPPSPQDIARDATWLAQALDPASLSVRLVRMDEDAYRASSFLDDRLLTPGTDSHVVAWNEIEQATATASRDDVRWIFHIGHVGSTLVARLLGELPSVLSVREPRFLRDLCAVPPQSREGMMSATRSLFSRSFSPGQCALVKATSFVSEIGAPLMGEAGRAIFLFVPPRNYIASILAGDNSVRELHTLAQLRGQRLAGRVEWPAAPRTESDLAAIAWACEMTSLEAAAAGRPDAHVTWVDFDKMLDTLEPSLRDIGAALSIDAASDAVAALAASPMLGRYSKAPEHAYTANLRREIIADAAGHFAPEIDAALALLDRAAEKSPLLARALGRAKGG